MSVAPLLLIALLATRRGPFAFHYGPSLSEERIEWYSRFELLVTHDPLPREQVDRLHAAGTKVLLYEWSVAFYDSRATEWQRSLLTRRKATLLNDVALTGGVGSSTAGAWYFDPASSEHRKGRAAEIVRRLESIGYDGVFFDTTTFESVHPEARREYQRRHPGTPYDAAFSQFLRELRGRLPKGVLFTNQGYRSAEHYLPHVDWDLTESLITWRAPTMTARPWNDPARPWESIRFVMKTMIEPVMQRYPRVRFGHLNYVDAADPEAIRLVVAVAWLFGGEGFVAGDQLEHEIDPIYFRDFGKPAGPRVDEANGSWRCFEHGRVGITVTGGEPRAFFEP